MTKKKCKIRLLFFFLSWIVLISSSWAGQVVTEDTRLWAKKVLQEEKAIPTLEGQNTLAVLYFQNITEKSELDPVQKGLTLMLISDLSTIKGIHVVERIRLQALTEEMGLGASGLVESNTAPGVGKLLRAQWLVGGNISGVQLVKLIVQASLLDVPAAKILGQPTAKGSLSDLLNIEKELLFDIVNLLKIEVKPEEEAKLRKPCSTNMNALIALFKGIDASDRKDYEKAAELYDQALKQDPDICVASESLAELQELGLITAHKRSQEMLQSLRDRTSLTDQLSPEDQNKRVKTPKDITTPVNIGISFP